MAWLRAYCKQVSLPRARFVVVQRLSKIQAVERVMETVIPPDEEVNEELRPYCLRAPAKRVRSAKAQARTWRVTWFLRYGLSGSVGGVRIITGIACEFTVDPGVLCAFLQDPREFTIMYSIGSVGVVHIITGIACEFTVFTEGDGNHPAGGS